MFGPAFVSLATLALSVRQAAAETHVIYVGSPNTTDIFSPQSVRAKAGDDVVFRFVDGNYTVGQSLFAQPCRPAHESDGVTNGFWSGPRPAFNGTTPSDLVVQIFPEHENKTTWFYEATPEACGFDETAVGGINLREESNETLAGFVRNAARLFGPDRDTDEDEGGSSSRSAGPRPTNSNTNSESAAIYRAVGAEFAVPVALVVAALGTTFF